MASGLIVIGTTVAGGFIGTMAGMMGAMFWADMDLGSSECPMFILGGGVTGVVAGAYIGAQIIAS